MDEMEPADASEESISVASAMHAISEPVPPPKAMRPVLQLPWRGNRKGGTLTWPGPFGFASSHFSPRMAKPAGGTPSSEGAVDSSVSFAAVMKAENPEVGWSLWTGVRVPPLLLPSNSLLHVPGCDPLQFASESPSWESWKLHCVRGVTCIVTASITSLSLRTLVCTTSGSEPKKDDPLLNLLRDWDWRCFRLCSTSAVPKMTMSLLTTFSSQFDIFGGF
mmetsp:Transcript_87563/g.227328  ORF Transcript_87563/g.227328 Transcript_87563/m.227328 type:complete len:220 (-) Transcript_87563:774-1433(-)